MNGEIYVFIDVIMYVQHLRVFGSERRAYGAVYLSNVHLADLVFFPRKKFFRREDNALFPLDAPPPRLSGMLRSEGKGVKGELFSLK